jgi:hypothetical protein
MSNNYKEIQEKFNKFLNEQDEKSTLMQRAEALLDRGSRKMNSQDAIITRLKELTLVMKGLATLYKQGDKSVIDTLKMLTPEKNKAEKRLKNSESRFEYFDE